MLLSRLIVAMCLVTRAIIVASCLVATVAPSLACNYGTSFGLIPGEDEQTTVYGLFQGIYNRDQSSHRTKDWQREAADLEAAGAGTGNDPGKALDYAWALHMGGQNPKAITVYQSLLKANPNNYEALCSYATVLHNMREYPLAAGTLQKAIALKPGFRNNAEEFHLAMIDFQQKSRANFAYAQQNIFVPALTPIWNNRKGVDENLSTVGFPEGYTSEGMAELLRQFPNFGEAWLALGMLLEHEKDFSMAAKAYDRALDKGTAHGEDLRRYMTEFREFGRANDPGRVAGKRFVQIGIGIVVLLVLLYILRVVSRVIADVTSARASKQERERMARRKYKDPDSPL